MTDSTVAKAPAPAPVAADDDKRKAKLLPKALASLPLFAGLEAKCLKTITERAELRTVPEHKEVLGDDGEPLLIVISGALQVCVSSGPMTTLGPGGVLNEVGFLSLARHAAPFKPTLKSTQDPSKSMLKGQSQSLELASGDDKKAGNVDKQRTISNLCPQAQTQLTAESCGQKLSGWLRLATVSAEGGATVAAVTMDLLREILKNFPSSSAKFDKNKDALTSRMLAILRSFVLPGAPPQVVLALAAVSERKHIAPEELIVKESEAGEASESVFLIEEGDAIVEKLMAKGGRAIPTGVGQIGAGAIIGDICFVGSKVPRMAAVRAKTSMKIIELPMKGLLSVLRRYPGIIACMKNRLRETAMLLQPSLPSRANVLSMVGIFSKCSSKFIRDIVGVAERHMFFCGHEIKTEGTSDTTFSVAEFGLCSVETKEKGLTHYVHMNNCFGERTLLGTAEHADATVTVASPLALLLTINYDAFKLIIDRHPQQLKKLEQGATQSCNTGDISKLDVLKRCGPHFIEAIVGAVQMRCYMPGQTITIEGSIDAGSMFVMKGGRASVEVKGAIVNTLNTGTAFGELAMLGLVRRRTSTVRAVSLCFLFEIPRVAFLAALETHPEEREQFEELTMKQNLVSTNVLWSFFAGTPPRLMYLVNLYAERRITPVGVWTSRQGEPLATNAAILLLQGSLRMEDDEGNVVAEIGEGSCFNEQVLLGLPQARGKIVPKVSSEVQIMTKFTFERICNDFPDQVEQIRQKVVEEMVGKAEHRLGFQRASAEVLRLSALFRAVPDPFANHVRKLLIPRLYEPEAYITKDGEEGSSMFFILDGDCHVDGQKGSNDEPIMGRVHGEAIVLGIANHYPISIRSSAWCVALELTREGLEKALKAFPKQREVFEGLFTSNDHGVKLRDRLHQNSLLSQAGSEFVSQSCEHAIDSFYSYGDVIMERGYPCKLGESNCYVLLSGQAIVEGEYNIRLGSVGPGDVFGEGGAVGLADTRNATVRAWKGGLTHCAQLHGTSMLAAVKKYPKDRQALADAYDKRQAMNSGFAEQRRQWLENIVVPALATCSVFAGFPIEVLNDLSKPLEAIKYEAGQMITECGDACDNLLVLTEGEAAIIGKNGEVVGTYTSGAVFGEIAVLGLFPMRIATVQAACDCKILSLSSSTIQQVLSIPRCAEGRLLLDDVILQRREQVADGMPLCALPIDVRSYDVTIRAVSLQAQRLDLRVGETLWPHHDTGASGPHVLVLTQGRGAMYVGDDARPVMQIDYGIALPEGVAASNKARMVAATTCVIYRIRMFDILLAVGAKPDAKKWFEKLQGLLHESEERMFSRLSSAKGATTSKEPRDSAFIIRERVVQKRQHQIYRESAQERAMEQITKTGRSKSMSSLPRIVQPIEPRRKHVDNDWRVVQPIESVDDALTARVTSSLPNLTSTTGLPWHRIDSIDVRIPASNHKRNNITGQTAWHHWGLKPPSQLCVTLAKLSKSASTPDL